MKRILQQAFIGITMAITFLAVSACKDIFHSKEDINYAPLIQNKEYTDGISKDKKNYYKFNVQQGNTYNIDIKTEENTYYYHYRIYLTAFYYDTETTVIGKQEVILNDDKSKTVSFTASRTGDVVVRVSDYNDDYYKKSISYIIMYR